MPGFKIQKSPPFSFVLEALERANPLTKPMFGCLAVYVQDKIVLILREKKDHLKDNGVWLATIPEHHKSLQSEFPSMRSISMFGPGPTGWQNLPSDSEDFEQAALYACDLVLKGDPRIGKIPKPKRKASKKKTKKS